MAKCSPTPRLGTSAAPSRSTQQLSSFLLLVRRERFTVAREDSEETLAMVQTIETRRGAKGLALDPKSHKFYVAATDSTSANSARDGAALGSSKILVYAMEQNPGILKQP